MNIEVIKEINIASRNIYKSEIGLKTNTDSIIRVPESAFDSTKDMTTSSIEANKRDKPDIINE